MKHTKGLEVLGTMYGDRYAIFGECENSYATKEEAQEVLDAWENALEMKRRLEKL